jgi:membrane-bound lytic murein transglycosylase A
LAIGTLFCTGCGPQTTGPLISPPEPADYERQLGPGELALARVDPKDVPDFTAACMDKTGLRDATERSLHYLAKQSSQKYFPYGHEITHDQTVASLQEFERMLDSNMSPAQMNASIREKFDVYTSVGWNRKGTVLFTGYYTPIFDASATRTDKFRYPLFKAPANLVKDDDGQVKGCRDVEGNVTMCPSRKEIEQGNMYAGSELYWLSDPFEVYIAHVQGSAKLRLADNPTNLVTVGYCASNGHDYVSVGRKMVADGKIPKGSLSLQALIRYFKEHPGDIQTYTWQNPRFVFFDRIDGEPRGCLNEPVTQMRTIATDKQIFPRAGMTFITTALPRRSGGEVQDAPFSGFLLDQDAGSAIRAPGRADVYMGIGDQAAELAGRTQQEGRLYYLFLKPAQPRTPSLTGPTTMPAAPGCR